MDPNARLDDLGKERYVYRAGSRTLCSPVYGLVILQSELTGFV